MTSSKPTTQLGNAPRGAGDSARRDNAARTPPTGGPPQPTMPPRRTLTWFLLILLLNFLIARALFPPSGSSVTVPYTLFRDQVTKRNVAAIYSRGDRITGRFRTTVSYAPKADSASKASAKKVISFATTLPSFVDPGFEGLLIANGVEISAEPIEQGGSPLSTLLFGFGPALLLIVFYVWMFRRAAKQGGAAGMGGLLGIGQSRARRFD